MPQGSHFRSTLLRAVTIWLLGTVISMAIVAHAQSEGTAKPALPYTPNAGLDKAFATKVPVLAHIYIEGRKAFPEFAKAARIRMENFKGAVLLIAVGDDQMWPAADMATSIAATRKAAGLDTEVLLFPKAGHLVGGDGYSPNDYNTPFAMGGNAKEDAHAQTTAWPATMRFLKKALQVSP
ncbi:acyl-CoA thioester hydrolase/BAAT C-terminal domain-containing protein [Undibacterium sp. TJN19]|uniref:acyl-CoA thioester hydrolase/BAAT C-terminal domain-containing protein n=1 Tax=Undibacterium sp. TJN19 TaxID=3413055 RepID=UPI003BEFABEB